MRPSAHPAYRGLVEKVSFSHERGRSPSGFTAEDIALARLYSYAFRLHTIGAYHSTRLALLKRPAASALAMAHRQRAAETLEDLANQAMELVPDDVRAPLSTFWRYHQGVHRVIESLAADRDASNDAEISGIAQRFAAIVDDIVSHNGIHLTRDIEPAPQASFIVPNLGITIAPLVYGDYHSWNLAYLDGPRSDVPAHRHHQGVEIHLGYSPLRGHTILSDHAAEVTEGYAMPIPPMTRHGYTNGSELKHHVPFIFGSLHHGGWGVFLDVEAQPTEVSDLKIVSRNQPPFRQTIYLEREIASAARSEVSRRWTLIPASVTDRGDSGGLELSIGRATERGFESKPDRFTAVSIVKGTGVATVGGSSREVNAHDHFAVPAGLSLKLIQSGPEPLVFLDSVIKAKFR